nr:hypothetical protein CcurKRNrm1_p141 [Cryptomonas curvata]
MIKMFKDTVLWNYRNFQFIFKKKEKFFAKVFKLKYKRISIKKKKKIFVEFFLNIFRKFLIIGCVISITIDRAIIIGLHSHSNYYSGKNFCLHKKKIYGKNFFFINISNCISVGDIVIAKIDELNQQTITTFNANLGVLLSMGSYYRFMLPISSYEMMCCETKKKKFKKVSRLSLW